MKIRDKARDSNEAYEKEGFYMEVKRQNHEFPPVYDENSEILILGSFPSVKSREMQFFLWTSTEPFLEGAGSGFE